MAAGIRSPPSEILTEDQIYDDLEVEEAAMNQEIPADVGTSIPVPTQRRAVPPLPSQEYDDFPVEDTGHYEQDGIYANDGGHGYVDENGIYVNGGDIEEPKKNGSYEADDDQEELKKTYDYCEIPEELSKLHVEKGKPLKTLDNNSRTGGENQSTENNGVSTQHISFQEAYKKFERGGNENPAMSKPTGITKSPYVHSVSSTKNYTPSVPDSRKQSITSAKDMPLPPLPGEQDDDFEVTYATCSSNQEQFQLLSQPWYHGSVDRNEAVRKVKQLKEDGSFLVRDSATSADQPYTLVLLYNNVVKNLKIRSRKDGKVTLGEEQRDEVTFKDVVELVEYHQKFDIILVQERGMVKLQRTPPKS
ncbi:B-cell linker protein-like [Gigantopelta aegis]|uniref:B-cell linker protein-like n=1 Tax=Gigantopelta aegis TaxID=1735272 RepID=UPI001B887515|nr:B-cell linker protein-like [Gigantopelta aegis]